MNAQVSKRSSGVRIGFIRELLDRPLRHGNGGPSVHKTAIPVYGRKEFLDKLLVGLAERMYYQQPTAYLVEMGPPVVPDLVRNLNHENAVVRERLCGVLGLIGDSSTIEQLKPLLQDSNQNVASEAALAIRRLGARS